MDSQNTSTLDLPSLASALTAFVAYLLLAFWVLSQGHLHEDAYILFTYSEHLASGDGIVYFLQGERAEGATDFLWMVLLAALVYLGADIGAAAAVLNGLGVGLIVYLLTLNLRWPQSTLSKLATGLLFCLLLITSEITGASISGFSTAFYASIAVLVVHIYLNANIKTLAILPWASLLLGLIRPDGVIIGVFASLIGLERVWATKYRSLYLFGMVGAGLLGVIYFAWRFSYFGHMLPLPLYVKSYSEATFPGLRRNISFLLDKAVLLSIAGLALALVKDVRQYILAFFPVIALLIGLSFAHQSQNVAYRFQAPVTGTLLLSLAFFLNAYLLNTIPWKRVLAVIVVLPIVASGTAVNPQLYRYLTNSDYINYFPFLAADLLNHEVSLALTEAGRLAYWTDAKTYDLVGLNTSRVATNKLSLSYLEDLSPDVIFIHTAGTLKSFSEVEGDTVLASVEFIDQHLNEQIAWEEVRNPVKRAPYVVYEYLRRYPDKHDLVFARYGDEFKHLYAVKKGGNVDWVDFADTLERSFDDRERLSYLGMKRFINRND